MPRQGACSPRGLAIDFRTGFAESLPLSAESFDIVGSLDVLEHARDVAQAMVECFRALKPVGRMLLAFPQYLHPYESPSGW